MNHIILLGLVDMCGNIVHKDGSVFRAILQLLCQFSLSLHIEANRSRDWVVRTVTTVWRQTTSTTV